MRRTFSASSSAPSSEPRRRRSGQISSWTPATTTTSHSRPLDRCAVSTRTQSSRTACSASVSPAISWPARLSANRPGAPGGMVSAKWAALSNRASTASRSRSAAAPAGPAAAETRCHSRASPEASQIGPQHVLGAAARADRGPRHREQPGDPLGRLGHAGRQRDQVPRVEQGLGDGVTAGAAGPASSGGRVVGTGGIKGAPRAGFAEQLQGASQAAQAEGVGAAERAAQQLGGGLLVQLGRPQRAAQQHEQRPGAGLVGQRQLVARHRDRDARGGQCPAQQRDLPGGRTHQHRHRRPRHAVGQVSTAQCVGDQGRFLGRAVGHQDADLARRDAGNRDQVAVRRRTRCPEPCGSRRATRREAASRTGPLRRQVRSATTGAGWPSAVRNRSGNSVSARRSAPRKA